MAEFCKQCAVDVFGEDTPSDFNFTDSVELDEGYHVLCEGCGHAWVDERGVCKADNCLKKHGAMSANNTSNNGLAILQALRIQQHLSST